MRTKTWMAIAVAIVVFPLVAGAQGFGGRAGIGRSGGGPRGGPSFMSELYPPELIMRSQSELQLTDAQKDAIIAATRETRNALDPLQWELEEKQGELTALLAAPTVDETALLAQAEEVMNLEKEVKKQHLLLLVKIKNQLTPEQQATAKKLRGSGRRGGPRGGPRGGGPSGLATPPGGRP